MLNENKLNLFFFGIFSQVKICHQNACFQFQLKKYSSQISICLEWEKVRTVHAGSHNKYFYSVLELINPSLFSVKCKIGSAHVLLIYKL